IDNISVGSKQATFTILTSPDVSTANFWGHMPNSILVGERQFHRTPLASEENGASGNTFTENGEVWGQFTKVEGHSYCSSNLPTDNVLTELYTAHPSGAVSRNYGWPTAQSYLTNSANQVINLSTGVASSSSNTHSVSCFTGGPMDSSGVTIDILKEDGSYTNDRFPPSSIAMTYGALMFPGAGIRINLPDRTDASSIKVSAPHGYLTEVIGKSIHLTDMSETSYKDKVISVSGIDNINRIVGWNLKVSDAKFKPYDGTGYLPYVDSSSNVLTVNRGSDYPSEISGIFTHGMMTSARFARYTAMRGVTERGKLFSQAVAERQDFINSSVAFSETGSLTNSQQKIMNSNSNWGAYLGFFLDDRIEADDFFRSLEGISPHFEGAVYQKENWGEFTLQEANYDGPNIPAYYVLAFFPNLPPISESNSKIVDTAECRLPELVDVPKQSQIDRRAGVFSFLQNAIEFNNLSGFYRTSARAYFTIKNTIGKFNNAWGRAGFIGISTNPSNGKYTVHSYYYGQPTDGTLGVDCPTYAQGWCYKGKDLGTAESLNQIMKIASNFYLKGMMSREWFNPNWDGLGFESSDFPNYISDICRPILNSWDPVTFPEPILYEGLTISTGIQDLSVSGRSPNKVEK
ncbi:adhesion domain-containing protein, partial [Vibrio vulnificus]